MRLKGVVFFFVLFAGSLVSQAAEGAEKKMIAGLVQPLAYDENERLVGVAIETPDGPYAVVTDRKGKELHRHLDKWVEAIGLIVEDKDGNRAIKVKRYWIINN
jgi:hypothetical protein